MFPEDVRNEIWASLSEKCVLKIVCRDENIDRILLNKGKVSVDRLWPLAIRKNAQGTAAFLVSVTNKDMLKDLLIRSTKKKRYAIAKFVLEGLIPQMHEWEIGQPIAKAFEVTFKRGKHQKYMTELLINLAQAYQQCTSRSIESLLGENTINDILAHAVLPVADCIQVLGKLNVSLPKRADPKVLDHVLRTDDRDAFAIIKQHCTCNIGLKESVHVHSTDSPDIPLLLEMHRWYPVIDGGTISRLCHEPEAKEYQRDLIRMLPDSHAASTICALYSCQDWLGMKDLMIVKAHYTPSNNDSFHWYMSKIDLMHVPFKVDIVKWQMLIKPESIHTAYFDFRYVSIRQQLLDILYLSEVPTMILHLCDVKDWQAVNQLIKRRPSINIRWLREIRQKDPPEFLYDKLLELIPDSDVSCLLLELCDEKNWRAVMQMATRCFSINIRVIRAVSFRKPPDHIMDILLRNRQKVQLSDCYQPQLREAFLKSLVNDPGCHTPEDYSNSVFDFIRAVSRNNVPMESNPDIALMFSAQVGARVQADDVLNKLPPKSQDLERYLDMAVSWKQIEVAELFVKRGAPVSRYARDKSRIYGWKLLDLSDCGG